MTESEIRAAALTGCWVRDFDGEIGKPTGNFETDGETTIAEIIAPNFQRWSDTLDLELVV